MNPETINKTIAELCGFEDVRKSTPWQLTDPPDERTPTIGTVKVNGKWVDRVVPNYYGDLNACHETEMTLTDDNQYAIFRKHLCDVLGSGFRTYSTTAPQRCEAFLRVHGKWEETK